MCDQEANVGSTLNSILSIAGTHLGESDGILALIQIAFIEPKAKLENLEQATIVENLRIYFFDILVVSFTLINTF